MKKCPKCGNKFSDNMENCTECGEPLEECKSRIDIFYEKSKKTKNIVIGLMLVASFVFGCVFCSAIGTKKAEYDKLQTEYQELQSKYDTTVKNYEKLTAEKKDLDSKYNEYKEQMQPYEAQRDADIKATEEKKAAEEQAKKEAEEQAKKVAEAEAAKQAKTTKQSQAASTQNESHTVYITNSGSKYHSSGCQYLKKSKIAISEDKAISQGYTACSKCHP